MFFKLFIENRSKKRKEKNSILVFISQTEQKKLIYER